MYKCRLHKSSRNKDVSLKHYLSMSGSQVRCSLSGGFNQLLQQNEVAAVNRKRGRYNEMDCNQVGETTLITNDVYLTGQVGSDIWLQATRKIFNWAIWIQALVSRVLEVSFSSTFFIIPLPISSYLFHFISFSLFLFARSFVKFVLLSYKNQYYSKKGDNLVLYSLHITSIYQLLEYIIREAYMHIHLCQFLRLLDD